MLIFAFVDFSVAPDEPFSVEGLCLFWDEDSFCDLGSKLLSEESGQGFLLHVGQSFVISVILTGTCCLEAILSPMGQSRNPRLGSIALPEKFNRRRL